MKPTFIITLLALGLQAHAAIIGNVNQESPDLVARQRGGDRGEDDEPTFTIGRGKGKGKAAKGKGGGEERVGKGKGKSAGKGKSEGKGKSGKGKSGKGKSEGNGKGGKGKGLAEPVCVWEGHCLGKKKI